MDGKLLELLVTIENLSEKELEYLIVWIEYNQQKKSALSAQPPKE